MPVAAMSDAPEDDIGEETDTMPYTPAEWQQNADADADAAGAIEHGDLRLLAFATRGTSIPGIEPATGQRYTEQCGVRYLKGFGDVIRSENQLQAMTAAHAWAEAYNRLIIEACRAAR